MSNDPNYNFFSVLYEQEKESMYWYAASQLRNDFLAEEAVQEAFLIALEKIEVFVNVEKPEGWLFGILKNVIKRIKAEEYKLQRRFISINEHNASQSLSTNDEIDPVILFDGVVSREDLDILQKLYVHGYTYKDITDEMGIHLSTVGMRAKRAKEKFGGKYEK